MLLEGPLKNHLGTDDEKATIQEEVIKIKKKLNTFQDVVTTRPEIIDNNKNCNKKKINESNENIINDDTLIYFYQGKPVYIEFLNSDESKKNNFIIDDDTNYLNILLKDLTSDKCIFFIYFS